MRWQVNRDATGCARSITFLGDESPEEKSARDAGEKRRRVALKRQPYPEAREWCEARGMLDKDGCLKEG